MCSKRQRIVRDFVQHCLLLSVFHLIRRRAPHIAAHEFCEMIQTTHTLLLNSFARFDFRQETAPHSAAHGFYRSCSRTPLRLNCYWFASPSEAPRKARPSRAMKANVSGTHNRVILQRHISLGTESAWSLPSGRYQVFLHVETAAKTNTRPATKKFHITFEDRYPAYTF